jgi:hypothetical protein
VRLEPLDDLLDHLSQLATQRVALPAPQRLEAALVVLFFRQIEQATGELQLLPLPVPVRTLVVLLELLLEILMASQRIIKLVAHVRGQQRDEPSERFHQALRVLRDIQRPLVPVLLMVGTDLTLEVLCRSWLPQCRLHASSPGGWKRGHSEGALDHALRLGERGAGEAPPEGTQGLLLRAGEAAGLERRQGQHMQLQPHQQYIRLTAELPRLEAEAVAQEPHPALDSAVEDIAPELLQGRLHLARALAPRGMEAAHRSGLVLHYEERVYGWQLLILHLHREVRHVMPPLLAT